MHYSITLLTPVATPYGLSIDHWEFPRVPAEETSRMIQIADDLGWDYLIYVSMTKDVVWSTGKVETVEVNLCETHTYRPGCPDCEARVEARR
jgi:hypothetical protein